MCGIAGDFDSERGASADDVRAMIARLRHRGPDAEGVWVTETCAIGCARLAIRGGGDLPAPLTGERQTLAYNGELFPRPSRHGDTRWLLEALERAGPPTLDTVDGMYALGSASHDGRELILARDRYGIKPLYVLRDASRICFASELAPLRPLAPGPPTVEPSDALSLLGLGIAPPQLELLPGVRALAPGTILRATTTSCDVIRRASPMSAAPTAPLHEVIAASVRRCVAGEGPVGLFLSGGVDSAALAAALARDGRRDVVTFSLLIGEDGVRDLARLGLPGSAWRSWRHHTIRPTHADLTRAYGAVLAGTSSPVFPASAAYTLMLARAAAREGVRVALSGEGADELFAGYSSHVDFLASGRTPAHAFYTSAPALRWAERIVAGGTAARVELEATLDEEAGPGPRVAALLALERRLSLTPLLARLDETSMRHAVEVRVPYLHGGVPEAAAAQAGELEDPLPVTKPTLRAAARELGAAVAADAPKRPLRVTAATLGTELPTHGIPDDLPLRRERLDGLLRAARRGDPGAGLVARRLAQLASFTLAGEPRATTERIWEPV